MKYIYALLLSFGLLVPQLTPVQERPVVNLPRATRQDNWGGGSCVYATTVTLLNWQGRYQTAKYIRRAYSGGSSLKNIVAKLDRLNIRYAYCTRGDVKFLEWACRTRRGAGVVVTGGVHFVTLVHLDNNWACILDNNSTHKFQWISRGRFLAEWRASGGWAIAVVYSPAAPLP